MENRFLIMSIILIAISVLLLITLAFYYYQFKKINSEAKKYGLTLPIVTLILICLSKIMGIITAITQSSDPITVPLVTTVIGMICLLSSVIILFFFISNFGIALTKQSIHLIGEKIDNKNIKKIIEDTRTGNIVIFYSQGKRVIKKMKISKKLVQADFFDEKITGFKVEKEDALAYYNKSIRNK